MKEALVECVSCGHRFVVKVFERGEAEKKQILGYPIRCESCKGEVKLVCS